MKHMNNQRLQVSCQHIHTGRMVLACTDRFINKRIRSSGQRLGCKVIKKQLIKVWVVGDSPQHKIKIASVLEAGRSNLCRIHVRKGSLAPSIEHNYIVLYMYIVWLIVVFSPFTGPFHSHIINILQSTQKYLFKLLLRRQILLQCTVPHYFCNSQKSLPADCTQQVTICTISALSLVKK